MQDENQLNKPRSLDEALTHLVNSIAIEEEALATLMRAEADKTLAFVGKNRELPTQPSNSEFIQFNQSVTKLLDSILMAEWMLMKKIDSVMQFQYLAQSSAIQVNVQEELDAGERVSTSGRHERDADYYNELDEIDY
ncbi:hypothetical protein WMW72_32765 [Paenibacillus filicis]|uniref:Uncharacterized protein n=1 Tax=Paenibacillus filicis TaxID=669464 RepID=A0ABU9DUY3_9BACL